MRVKLLYFHRAREAAGRPSDTVALPAGSTAADALRWAIQQHAGLRELTSVLRIAVNEEYARNDQPLADGDVVALLPPLSGG